MTHSLLNRDLSNDNHRYARTPVGVRCLHIQYTPVALLYEKGSYSCAVPCAWPSASRSRYSRNLTENLALSMDRKNPLRHLQHFISSRWDLYCSVRAVVSLSSLHTSMGTCQPVGRTTLRTAITDSRFVSRGFVRYSS